jgi:hypothetical protein
LVLHHALASTLGQDALHRIDLLAVVAAAAVAGGHLLLLRVSQLECLVEVGVASSAVKDLRIEAVVDKVVSQAPNKGIRSYQCGLILSQVRGVSSDDTRMVGSVSMEIAFICTNV